MATLRDHPDTFPHATIRIVNDQPEPYLPGTGLAVWEIAWLSRVYEGDVDALARHLEASPINHALIEEALEYARANPDELPRLPPP
ncbi:MAG: hypothetical protein ACR2JC_13630 [Chloroflexota bacterium]|nr:MAG: hypothetical protein DLM70_07605 [Chloroflexota bacterium]